MSTAFVPEMNLVAFGARFGIDVEVSITSDPREYRLTTNKGVFLFLGSPDRCSDYLGGVATVYNGGIAPVLPAAILEHNFSSLNDTQTLTPALLAAANALGWVTNPRTWHHYCPTHRRA